MVNNARDLRLQSLGATVKLKNIVVSDLAYP